MLKRKKTSLSIRRIIMDLFRFTMIATLTVVLLLVFRNWNTSVKETTQRLSQHISNGIYEEIDQFVHIPQRMNELNHGFIESGLLSEPNSKQWERFFTDVLSSYESDIYSFTYGTEAGEYYGARRNEQGIIEIVKNNNETGGSSWYYSTNEDGTAGSLVMQTGPFDPRTRVWYQDVVKANAPIMSPVYKHFVMSDLTISAGWPIYNQAGELQGVLASHMLLTDIGHHIQEVVSEFQGFAFFVERESGFLVGNSLGAPNFSVLPDGSIRRYNISSLNEDEISRAYRQYLQQDQPTFIYEGSEDHYYITTKTFVLPGVDWVLLSAIPESLLLEEVSNSTQLALMLAMIFYGLSKSSRCIDGITKPIEL